MSRSSPPLASSDLSSEPKSSVPSPQQRVVHRLDAQPIAGEEQRLAVAVPEREREHAAKARHALLAPGLPGVDDHLGVAVGAKDVAQRLQFGHQLLEVVDLAVEDDADAAVLVEQRLLAGGHVDDRQPPMAEADTRLDVHAALVGAAVVLRFVHAHQGRAIDVALAAGVEDAGDAAHGWSERVSTCLDSRLWRSSAFRHVATPALLRRWQRPCIAAEAAPTNTAQCVAVAWCGYGHEMRPRQ